ncbi:tetratricopeptide repeat protein [Brevundimonas lenta]|uniref:CBM-cenC domain-containing protein n=1 Tax=Brevundimonas lenta TaxID=424796 RepID=A0A7W6JFC5_9CAUL|nr:hypothetical protein [Brevundimonas lenta]MBB4084145.1 hypothetical protein [Brevundimonas lenta]
MRDQADPSALPAQQRGLLAGVAPYALIVGGILLAWQVAIQPIMQRAPPAIAVRVAPGSPSVLRRAAEGELAENRNDNAASLAREALARSPFDVRALRVVGLTEARAGREAQADDILTLAGNWSLRDDPAHAWLVEYRLRRGDYASSFAHADTLVRRRDDIRPRVFTLFTAAATHDPQRAMPEVARLLAAKPPWRQAYLESLYASTEGLQLAANLALMLQKSRAPLSNDELHQLYIQLLEKGQLDAVRTVRARLNRPVVSNVTNGGFGDTEAPQPFQWRLAQDAGVVAEIVSDDIRPADPALRVDYDGYSSSRIAEQLMFLPPGRYRLTAESRAEAGDPASRLAMTVTCAPGDLKVLSTPAAAAGATVWTPFAASFTIPSGCPAQWLRLETRAGDKREQTALWLDRVAITAID